MTPLTRLPILVSDQDIPIDRDCYTPFFGPDDEIKSTEQLSTTHEKPQTNIKQVITFLVLNITIYTRKNLLLLKNLNEKK